jgi:N-acetylmuramoyl-L-alanine amidase
MTSVLGPTRITYWQARAYVAAKPQGLYQPHVLDLIVNAYFEVGSEEGVRPEIGLAQSLKETGYFRFGGAVKPEQNNFAGIGATGGGVPGHSWPTIMEGVRGHLRRLRIYATPKQIIDQAGLYDLDILLRALPERYWGSSAHVEDLGGKWAPAPTYGTSIVNDYLNPMMAFPDPSRPLEPGELVEVRKLIG